MTTRCAVCEQAPGVGIWAGKAVCDSCAAGVELAHLRKVGRLRATLNHDGTQVVTRRGAMILPVLTCWGWKQPVRREGWATIWHVVAVDRDTGELYQGRGGGPGKPVTLHHRPQRKRVRDTLKAEGL